MRHCNDTFAVAEIAFFVLGAFFLICEVGERVNYHFDMFFESYEQCDWYRLPIGFQEMYLIFASDTQQPKKITCYGDIDFTRDTFKKVLFRLKVIIHCSFFSFSLILIRNLYSELQHQLLFSNPFISGL